MREAPGRVREAPGCVRGLQEGTGQRQLKASTDTTQWWNAPPRNGRQPRGLPPAPTLTVSAPRGPARRQTQQGPRPTHLGGDVEGPVPAHRDLLLHHAEAVEPAEQQAGAVRPQVEVHIVTQEPAQSQRRGQVRPQATHVPAKPRPAADTEWGARSRPTGLRRGRHRGNTNKENAEAVTCGRRARQGVPEVLTTGLQSADHAGPV